MIDVAAATIVLALVLALAILVLVAVAPLRSRDETDWPDGGWTEWVGGHRQREAFIRELPLSRLSTDELDEFYRLTHAYRARLEAHQYRRGGGRVRAEWRIAWAQGPPSGDDGRSWARLAAVLGVAG